MFIVAITNKGREYAYNYTTAHKVSKASAYRICDCLNENRFHLKENQVWYVYDIDQYDMAYDFASNQEFRVYKDKIKEYAVAKWRY